MRILVSGASSTVLNLAVTKLGRKYLGHLFTPQIGNTLGSLLRSGLPWACDNAAYSNPDDRKFWNLSIDAWDWDSISPPDWVAVPDVVGDHAATVESFESWTAMWEYEIGRVPFDMAFVLQNGATVSSVPWDRIAAVFVGGDDRFKLKDCHSLVAEAKGRGKLVHVGRVNSLSRLRYAIELGADTVDGSSFSMFPEKKIPRAMREIERLSKAPMLFA